MTEMRKVTRDEYWSFVRQFPHAIGDVCGISEPPLEAFYDHTGLMPDSMIAKHHRGTDNYWIAAD
jgi:hypothetical protein